MQASTLVRRYVDMRIASIRLPWALPRLAGERAQAGLLDEKRASKQLWAWVQLDSVAKAFFLGIKDNEKWGGHEAFFVAAPENTMGTNSLALRDRYFPEVRVREGKFEGKAGFFDCSKAERLLGWRHSD